jgi:hypothetical protein
MRSAQLTLHLATTVPPSHVSRRNPKKQKTKKTKTK